MSEASEAAFVWYLGSFLVGLVVGSFANVCIHRIPRRLSVVTPRSACPGCGTPIAAHDNVPVLSWLWLRGRCRSCRAPISIRYPLVEIGNALLWLAIARIHGPTAGAAIGMVLATAFLVLALIDADLQILPNVITLPGIVLGLLASLLPGRPEPLEAVAAAAVGYGGCAAVYLLWKWLRGIEALGQGDWKMIAMMGAFFGWDGMLLSVFLATLAGSIVGVVLMAIGRGEWGTKLPLGTFLSGGGIVYILCGQPLLSWYRGLLDG